MENFPSSKKGYESGKADNPQTATQREAEAARYKQPDREMNKFKQCVRIGRNVTDIFNLPCVIEVQKMVNGKPLYSIAAMNEHGKPIEDVAETGDWLCQDCNGGWQVLDETEYAKVNNH